MHLSFICKLSCPVEKLISGFDENLFRALSPAFPKVKILRFDGTKKGDFVELELDFFLFTWKWSSLITSSVRTEEGFLFVDSGIVLPPFLSYWEHHHILEKTNSGSRIRDEITFKPGKGWPSWLVRLMIWAQMQPRAGIYSRWFST